MDYLESFWQGRIKICTCPEANLSKSRNVGIINASGDVVCFTDDDGIPEPDWIDRLVKAYEDPQVAAAGGWVRNHTGVDYQTKFIVSSRASTSEVLIEDAKDVPEAAPFADKFPGLIGVNSSFRRSHLLEVGGFDEEYAYFLDETDVLVRMVDAGYKIAMVPNAEVHHKYAPSHIRAENGIAKSWLQIMKSTAYYIVKNAAPTTSLVDSLALVADHKRQIQAHTNWFHSQSYIDLDRHTQLMSEIDDGAARGISDAFAFPARQLIAKHELSPWLPLQRRPAEDRTRIALVTGLYPPRPCGGVAVFMHTLATQLVDKGHEVTVITQAEAGRPHTVDFEDGVWVHRLPSDDMLAPVFPAGMPDLPPSIAHFAGQALAELDRIAPHRQFDAVVGSIWDTELAAIIASRRYRTAMYLVTSYKLMEDSKPEWKQNKHFYTHHVSKMFAAETWCIQNSSRVLASTQAILEDVERAYGIQCPRDRTEILPFGVADATFDPEDPKAERSIRLLFVGRLEERKGIDTIIEALPEIMTVSDQIVFDLVGNDLLTDSEGVTYLQRCKDAYGREPWYSRIRFHGHVSDSELLDLYRNCSIFIAPSKYESFGLIYLEAMRFGKPCIGTWAGGIPEVVLDGATGLLIEPGNAEMLADSVRKLVKSTARRTKMGKAGRTRFEQTFTAQKFAERVLNRVEQWRSSAN
jgi:glycosyltransferase involved in cell wall biosynthesis